MNYIFNRLSEASTHGGFAGLFLGVQQIVTGNYIVGVPSVVGSLLAIFLPEKKA